MILTITFPEFQLQFQINRPGFTNCTIGNLKTKMSEFRNVLQVFRIEGNKKHKKRKDELPTHPFQPN